MIPAIVVVFFVLATLGMPLAFTLGIASFVGASIGGLDLAQIATKIVYSLDKFPLLAIPLFMLAGQLMLRGGIMDRILDLANAVVGRVHGGLAQVTVVAAMGLSSVSGSPTRRRSAARSGRRSARPTARSSALHWSPQRRTSVRSSRRARA
jgi:C4-dicarboxylate transporter DctM subunit